MFILIYLLSTILCIWGGCLVARVVANRLELGLFRRKVRRAAEAAWAGASVPIPKRRSAWWTLAAVFAMVLGGGVAFVAHGASNLTGPMFEEGWAESAWFAGTIASLGLSGGLALVGFRFDPALGRRRCPKCWYDLSGTKGLQCNECGHEAESERRLYRTRRSRVTIALALVPLLLAPIVMRVVYAWKVGWMGLVPTTVMVMGWDYMPESMVGAMPTPWGTPNSLQGSLAGRLGDHDVASWQKTILHWKCGSIARKSDDPRVILMATSLDVQDGVLRLMNQRIPFLMAELGSADRIRAAAAAELLQNLSFLGDESNMIRETVISRRKELIDMAVGPSEPVAISALSLLSVGNGMDSLNADEITLFEKMLADPVTTPTRRWMFFRLFSNNKVPSQAVRDMFLRLLDTGNVSARSNVFVLVVWASDDPRIHDRALKAIREGDPVLAANVCMANTRNDTGFADDVRSAILVRFGSDAEASAKMWNALMSVARERALSPSELDVVGPGVVRLLESKDSGEFGNALVFIDGLKTTHAGLVEALSRFIERSDLSAGIVSRAGALRDRLRDLPVVAPPPATFESK